MAQDKGKDFPNTALEKLVEARRRAIDSFAVVFAAPRPSCENSATTCGSFIAFVSQDKLLTVPGNDAIGGSPRSIVDQRASSAETLWLA